MAEKAAEAGTPKPGETKTADQIASDKATADAAAAAAAAGTKTPEQLTAEKATADAAAATKAAADAEAARKAGEGTPSPKAPAKYALTLPENTRLDATDVAAIEKLAKANDWTNEEAQAELVDRSTALEGAHVQFLAETTADPDYGGDHLAETQRLARRALDFVQPKGTPAGDRTRAVLEKTGLGNNLVFLSLMAEVGKRMAEDSPVIGRASAAGGERKPTEQVMYDKQPSAQT